MNTLADTVSNNATKTIVNLNFDLRYATKLNEIADLWLYSSFMRFTKMEMSLAEIKRTHVFVRAKTK